MIVVPTFDAGSATAAGTPLHITGRVLRAGELSGFSPRERPAGVTSVATWNEIAPSGGVDVAARLRRAGFVAAVREELAWKGGNDRGGLSVVVRLRSAAAARTELSQQLRDAADEPRRRPDEVKSYAAFAVPRIPGAHGFTLTATEGGGHNVIFADGPFVYHLGVGWGSGARNRPTRAQLLAAAAAFYDRVHGRPAP